MGRHLGKINSKYSNALLLNVLFKSSVDSDLLLHALNNTTIQLLPHATFKLNATCKLNSNVGKVRLLNILCESAIESALLLSAPCDTTI